MKTLTDKELEIMNTIWDKGPISMREIHDSIPEPRPHFNTIATMTHRLEELGFIQHQALGARFFLYKSTITREEYNRSTQKRLVNKFFKGSYINFISQLVKDEDVSINELKELINMVEKNK
jgi:BlaI family transcriptional regulator, penicillinase repressor